MGELRVVALGYDHPDAIRLTGQVQAEYVRRYGGPDESPIDAAQFDPPHGVFLLGYLDGEPVAMAGWRRLRPAEYHAAHVAGVAGPAAEVKRMYVAAQARGAGFARALLVELERTAAAAGLDWLLLETGSKQPEAIALYRSSGYSDVPAFGHYADAELSVHLGKRLAAAGDAMPDR
ncbi:MAG TPA: GNAT family N-acetyltransferase [Jatrophihabitans sp.]|nr:GNAT family N-acetyltransferase [Jatrophihabitans sp.]